MKKRKGFTLIELLAVIVILAIIALIATPLILGVLSSSRKKSFKSGAEGLLRSAKLAHSNQQIDQLYVPTIIYNCDNVNCVSDKKDNNDIPFKLDAEGDIGVGPVYIYADGKIAFNITNGVYCAVKYADENKINVYDGDCDLYDASYDSSAPVITDKFSRFITSNSFQFVVIAEDEQSPIKGYNYQLKKGNEIIVDYASDRDIKNENFYNFENLQSNTEYTVNVRIYNKLPYKKGYKENNNMVEDTYTITTQDIGTPIVTLVPNSNEYTLVKKAKIEYNVNPTLTGIVSSYEVRRVSDDEIVTGNDFYEQISDTELLFKQSGLYITVKNVDSVGNRAYGLNQVIDNIDRQNPEISLSNTKSSNSITVTANKISSISDIHGYMFSKDGGTTWESENGVNKYQSSNIYRFNNLVQNQTYNLKVKEINNANYNTSRISELSTYYENNSEMGIAETNVTPVTIDACVAPSYSLPNNDPEKWVQARVLKIENNAPDGYSVEYATVLNPNNSDFSGARNEDVEDENGNISVIVRNNGSITARVTDGVNICNASNTYVEDYIDNNTPNLDVTSSAGSNYITITASVTNNPSGVKYYDYSTNGGSSYRYTNETTNSKRISSLSTGTYTPNVKIYTNAWYNTVAAYRNDASGIVSANGDAKTIRNTSTPVPATNTPTPIPPTPPETCCNDYSCCTQLCESNGCPPERMGDCVSSCQAYRCS